MFVNGLVKKYNVDFMNEDISLHSGIPKEYYSLKNHNFGDWEIPPWELYIFKDRLIGEGSFSKVYLAKWRETFVVAKVVDPEFIRLKKEVVRREFDIMTKLHHPNIVQFLGYINDPFIIVLEYIPKMDLMSNIKSLTKKEKINITKDILRGLIYIHNRKPHNLIHRDIKPTNILLTNSKVAKISDFGLSKFYTMKMVPSNDNLVNMCSRENYVELTTNVGTERYMSPEILSSKEYNNKADIYSSGILLYELFENKKYIPGLKMQWYWTPKKIRVIIEKHMLCENPELRYDALMLIKIINRLY